VLQVHASDLRTLSSDSEITRALKDAPSSRSYPYVLNEEAGWALRQVAPGVAKMCGSRMVKYAPGEDTSDVQLDSGEKYAVVLDAPTLVGEGEERGDIMDEQSMYSSHISLGPTNSSSLGTAIASELQLLSAAFPNHLVIYAGLPVSSHFARAPAVFAPSNTTLPDGVSLGGVVCVLARPLYWHYVFGGNSEPCQDGSAQGLQCPGEEEPVELGAMHVCNLRSFPLQLDVVRDA
jgi:hypothetical protein